MRTIAHVDMDAFFASVELRRRPELKNQPMVVGGATRGVVLSATYPARSAGIRSGMPMTRARRLCPDVVVVSPNHDAYAAASEEVFALLETYTPVVEVASVDEAYCDFTWHGVSSAVATAELIRAQIADELGLPCSVGIGPNRFVAKVASQVAKPDAVREVLPEDVLDFLHPLPVSALWGVGEVTATRLEKLGLVTVADVARTPVETLQRAFGAQLGAKLHRLAYGADSQPVVGRVRERSVGSQQTFGRDTDDPAVVKRELLRMSTRTAHRMRQAGLVGRVVTLSLRMADFTEVTRSTTLRAPTDHTDEIYAHAVKLYDRLGLQRIRIRRVGVRVEQISDAAETAWQPDLLAAERGWREAERAVDAVMERFGPRAVQRAVLTRR